MLYSKGVPSSVKKRFYTREEGRWLDLPSFPVVKELAKDDPRQHYSDCIRNQNVEIVDSKCMPSSAAIHAHSENGQEKGRSAPALFAIF
ncbi:MAG: hypothetical protein WCV85_04250 [Patescibacteria group bacterium]